MNVKRREYQNKEQRRQRFLQDREPVEGVQRTPFLLWSPAGQRDIWLWEEMCKSDDKTGYEVTKNGKVELLGWSPGFRPDVVFEMQREKA